MKLPRGPLFPLACAAEAVARITGKEPFLTADALRMSRYRMFFTSAKAKRELGYTARPYQRGPRRCAGLVRRQRVSHMIAGILFGFLPLAIWLYLLLGRDGFWLLRERDTTPVRRARALAFGGGGGAGPQRSRCDRSAASAACWRRIIRAIFASCWWTISPTTAPASWRGR